MKNLKRFGELNESGDQSTESKPDKNDLTLIYEFGWTESRFKKWLKETRPEIEKDEDIWTFDQFGENFVQTASSDEYPMFIFAFARLPFFIPDFAKKYPLTFDALMKLMKSKFPGLLRIGNGKK